MNCNCKLILYYGRLKRLTCKQNVHVLNVTEHQQLEVMYTMGSFEGVCTLLRSNVCVIFYFFYFFYFYFFIFLFFFINFFFFLKTEGEWYVCIAAARTRKKIERKKERKKEKRRK